MTGFSSPCAIVAGDSTILRVAFEHGAHRPLCFCAVLGSIMEPHFTHFTRVSESSWGGGITLSRNSPQCLHFLAAKRINSAQNGHSLCGLGSGSVISYPSRNSSTSCITTLALTGLPPTNIDFKEDVIGGSATNAFVLLYLPYRYRYRLSHRTEIWKHKGQAYIIHWQMPDPRGLALIGAAVVLLVSVSRRLF